MHYRSFADKHKKDAVAWLDGQVASLIRNEHVDPKKARITVGHWCDVWLDGYGTNRASTVQQAKVHIKAIKATFGTTRVADVKPSDVKRWTTKLAGNYAPSTVYATYRRFAQIMGDAVDDGIIPRSPCSRKTAPPQAKQRPYVATTDQVWALHDAMPEHLRVAVLIGAFVGLRVAEAAALRVSDVDFMRGIVTPAIQYPARPLKREEHKAALPIPNELALILRQTCSSTAGRR
jgi:integrase